MFRIHPTDTIMAGAMWIQLPCDSRAVATGNWTKKWHLPLVGLVKLYIDLWLLFNTENEVQNIDIPPYDLPLEKSGLSLVFVYVLSTDGKKFRSRDLL
jgi:hypothetical protein